MLVRGGGVAPAVFRLRAGGGLYSDERIAHLSHAHLQLSVQFRRGSIAAYDISVLELKIK